MKKYLLRDDVLLVMLEKQQKDQYKSRTEIKIPLKKEEVQVTKQSYVKEEVAVKKKPVIETRTVSDQVTSEKVKVKSATREEEDDL